MKDVSLRTFKKRRNAVVAIATLLMVVISLNLYQSTPEITQPNIDVISNTNTRTELAKTVLERLEVKGRAPKTGYSRGEYGDGWGIVGGCDMRNIMLARGMTEVELADDKCVVLSGILNDPYTGNTIDFKRGKETSGDVQIDHVVALSDSWQKGAQELSPNTRLRFANDPLNLLAVDGPTNQKKSDSDAASWLPSNKSFRCQYVARQIAVKDKYRLWLTDSEKSAIVRVLNGCGDQVVPLSS